MYDNLIAALRNVSEYDSGYAKLMYDAADAIEELQNRVPKRPHGRLIDADAMIRDIERAIVPSRYIKERNADMVKFLSLEDTVIPASMEGE